MNEITLRYLQLIEELIDRKSVKDNKAFASAIGVSTSAITEISKGRSNVGLLLVHKTLSAFPEINLEWLFSGTGPMFSVAADVNSSDSAEKDPGIRNVGPFSYPQGGRRGITASDIKTGYSSGGIVPGIIPVTGLGKFSGKEFGDGLNERNYDVISLPTQMLREGSYVAVKMEGLSMIPAIHPGSYLISRRLEGLRREDIKEGFVYIFVVITGETYVRRLGDRSIDDNFMLCVSDNPDKTSFPDIRLDRGAVESIWIVEWILSPGVPIHKDPYSGKLEQLDEDMAEVKAMISRLMAPKNRKG